MSFSFLSLVAQSGQLLNPGFENWTEDVIYENPSLWKSSNMDNPNFNNLVTKSNDAQTGTFSVKLENGDDNGNVIFSYVYLGTIGDSGPSGGVPYTSDFNKVKGFFKCDIPAGDTSVMILVKFIGGNPVYGFGSFIGTQNSWTAFSFDVTPGAPDSIFFGFVNSNPMGNVISSPNSWLMVDNVSFENTLGSPPAALPNPSFEDWSAVTVENPDEWYSFNYLLSGMGITPVTKSSPGHTGSYAISMETYAFDQDTIPGFISVGEINIDSDDSPFGKIPYTARPITGSFYYKYTPSGNDNGEVQLAFYKNGNPIGAWSQPLTPTSTFELATYNFNLTESPDSMLLIFASGQKPGSQLYIDDVSFSGGDVSVQNLLKKAGFKEYPNPTSNVLFISSDDAISQTSTIEILDLNGKMIFSSNFDFSNNSVFEYSTNGLNSGIYYYRVINGKSVITRKFVVQ